MLTLNVGYEIFLNKETPKLASLSYPVEREYGGCDIFLCEMDKLINRSAIVVLLVWVGILYHVLKINWFRSVGAMQL